MTSKERFRGLNNKRIFEENMKMLERLRNT
jgi:hypothetical protein